MPGVMDKVMGAMTGLHARIYKASGGKVAAEMGGHPMVVLTTTGRKSGKKRERPLMRFEHDGAVHVIASKAGADTHPAWFLNIQADPRVHVQDGAEAWEATAVVLDEPDRTAVYEHAKAAMDNFVQYEQATDRTIPVVRLEPR